MFCRLANLAYGSKLSHRYTPRSFRSVSRRINRRWKNVRRVFALTLLFYRKKRRKQRRSRNRVNFLTISTLYRRRRAAGLVPRFKRVNHLFTKVFKQHLRYATFKFLPTSKHLKQRLLGTVKPFYVSSSVIDPIQINISNQIPYSDVTTKRKLTLISNRKLPFILASHAFIFLGVNAS